MSGHHLELDPDAVASARLTMYSQVAQEVQYVLLVGCAQHIELRNHLVGFRAAAREDDVAVVAIRTVTTMVVVQKFVFLIGLYKLLPIY